MENTVNRRSLLGTTLLNELFLLRTWGYRSIQLPAAADPHFPQPNSTLLLQCAAFAGNVFICFL